ncbi:nuclear transport factor 2-like isoform X2 [Chiloscyllium plagiosum]|uniref:nuclear transport factor 2-like isoform X2 n=1 Tax=Chiloscyllium plagiosum TaxID=36176 RepID=UPI001CB80005|nr:nuclear transport factor 2-like isoform X2 [Chiloscyllium plagiosum]
MTVSRLVRACECSVFCTNAAGKLLTVCTLWTESSLLYSRMAEHPLWEQIGRSFVHHYYQQFDLDRNQLGTLYSDTSCLTWEGQPFQGKAAIMEKIASLPFQKIQHSITAEDHQPAPDTCVLSMVVGQLKMCSNMQSLINWGQNSKFSSTQNLELCNCCLSHASSDFELIGKGNQT